MQADRTIMTKQSTTVESRICAAAIGVAVVLLITLWGATAIWRWERAQGHAIQWSNEYALDDPETLGDVRVPLFQFLWLPFRTHWEFRVSHVSRGWIEVEH